MVFAWLILFAIFGAIGAFIGWMFGHDAGYAKGRENGKAECQYWTERAKNSEAELEYLRISIKKTLDFRPRND